MGVALAALALGGPWQCTAHAGSKQHGRRIEFSNPTGDEGTNNLQQLTSKKDSLKQLEEDLYKSVRTFSSESSLDAVAPPPAHIPVPVVPSKRLKEQLDRRRNVFLLTPEDLVHEPTLQEMLKVPDYGPDGREKQSKTALELYYERQDKRDAGRKALQFQGDQETSDTAGLSSSRDVPNASGDLVLPTALEQRQQALKKLFESDGAESPLAPAAPAASKRGSFSDIFGLGEVPPTKEQALEHKKYMEEFSTLFETSRPNPANADALKPSGGNMDKSRKLANPFGVPDTSPAGNEALGLINPLFTPNGPPDVNVQTLGQPSPALKTELPKPPAAPTFTAPRRPF